MSGTVTAVRNVADDFGWLPDLLIALASNSVLALIAGGLISLLIWKSQTRLAYKLGLIEEKRVLFRKFIRQVEPAVFDSMRGAAYKECPEIRRLMGLEQEIALIGSGETSRCATTIVECVCYAVEHGPEVEVQASDGDTMKALPRVFREIGHFNEVARKELDG